VIALITGATAGFGKATAILLAKNGYDLIICGRRKDRLLELEKNIKIEYERKVLSLCFDIRNYNEVKNSIDSIKDEFTSIEVLVNNAGLASGLSTIQDGNIDDWEKMIDTNVKGLLYMTRCVSPLMIKNKKGHIVNIGSIAGKEVYANGNVYCASKFAVDALNKAMRLDMVQHGIRVSSINPGMAETEFSIVRFNGDEERAKNVYRGVEALSADDIAEAILWTIRRPQHVNINEMIIMPTAQANTTLTIRKE
jgi:3-hydroxy acid dehydrogenase/malonic semialdehyde reductase